MMVIRSAGIEDAERSNPDAIAFYERLGADVVSEKVCFRSSGNALVELAGCK